MTGMSVSFLTMRVEICLSALDEGTVVGLAVERKLVLLPGETLW